MKNIFLLFASTLLLVGIHSEAKADGLTKISGVYCSVWEIFGTDGECLCFKFLSESEYVWVSGGPKYDAPIKSSKPRSYRIEGGNLHLTLSKGNIEAYKIESSEKFTTGSGRMEFNKRIDLPKFCRD